MCYLLLVCVGVLHLSSPPVAAIDVASIEQPRSLPAAASASMALPSDGAGRTQHQDINIRRRNVCACARSMTDRLKQEQTHTTISKHKYQHKCKLTKQNKNEAYEWINKTNTQPHKHTLSQSHSCHTLYQHFVLLCLTACCCPQL